MVACASCGHDIGDPPAPFCPSCGHPSSTAALMGGPTASSGSPPRLDFTVPTCPNCKVAMNRSEELQFRVGGSVGASGMLEGNWNQLSEALQPFAIYHCPNCRRVDLYESGR